MSNICVATAKRWGAVGFFMAGLSLLPLNMARAQGISVGSPNQKISLTIAPTGGQLTYSVIMNGRAVILPSALGVVLDGQNLGENARFGRPSTHEFHETYPVIGGHSIATNSYHELDVPISSGTPAIPWQLEVRAFDDGVAYRYRIPGQGTRHLNREVSQWKLAPDCVIWYQDYTREYERPYQEDQVERLATGSHIGAPATVKLPDGLGYAMMTEANLVNYSDMGLEVTDHNTFNARFYNDEQGWSTEGEIVSPWRVTVVVPNLTALVNSDIIQNLCPPPAPELTRADWIRPGRSTWHWMVTGHPRLADQHKWVDWTKQLGFQYYLIDDGWRDWRADGKDQWACMKDVVDYARTQGVQIFAWVHSREIATPETRDAYLQKAKAVGLVGLKMDFMDGANVQWVNWYDETLRDLAKYQLMADFHGAIKPTGRERTWPNELTREAIFGRESGKLPALHDTALPFVRFAQGHADFTPTDFRLEKLGGSSWAHELAQAVIYTSPFLCYSGSPVNYLSNPAIDILQSVPSTWDETIVLPASEIGRTAAFARRKGDTWFIAIINGNEARPFPISLSFLPAGSYQLDQLTDALDNNAAWNRTRRTVTSASNFDVNLRGNGGFVARLTPIAH